MYPLTHLIFLTIFDSGTNMPVLQIRKQEKTKKKNRGYFWSFLNPSLPLDHLDIILHFLLVVCFIFQSSVPLEFTIIQNVR